MTIFRYGVRHLAALPVRQYIRPLQPIDPTNSFDVLGALTFGISALLTIYFEIPAGLAAIVLVQAQRILVDIYFGLMVYVMVSVILRSRIPSS